MSYAYKDRAFRDALNVHLSSLKRTDVIGDWHEHEILPGSDWQEVVDERLSQADIILLLITPDFVSSNFCYCVEMERALERHETGEARVIPILFRPTYRKGLPFTKLQGLPRDEREIGKAVSEWEDQDRAYVEIVEGIVKAIEDSAGSSSQRTGSLQDKQDHIWNIPYRSNPFFTARDELLNTISETFIANRGETPFMLAISGLAGIGKTQLALEYGYRHKTDYKAVCWLRGDSLENLTADFARLAHVFNLPEKKEAEQGIIAAAVKRYLQRSAGWLLIIDNLESFEFLDEVVPSEGQGDILLTTRAKSAAAMVAEVKLVEKMAPDEGALFLLRRSGKIKKDRRADTISPAIWEKARELCMLMDGLPLALEQAGAYIAKTQESIADFVQLYRDYEVDLLKQHEKTATDYPWSVATTFALCMDSVRRRDRAAWELLQLCAFLQPDAIPLELFRCGAPDFETQLQQVVSNKLKLNAALASLLGLSLIQRNSDEASISIHRLVQVVIRNEMDESTQRIWAERALRALNRAFPLPDYPSWLRCEQYLPHVLQAFTWVEQWHFTFREAGQLLWHAGKYLYERAHYLDAQKLCELALSIAEQRADAQAETAGILYSLGRIYASQEDFPRAQQCYERALEMGERIWSVPHREIARMYHHLGELFHDQGQFLEAERYYQRSLAIREQLYGTMHPETAASLNNLAGIREELGDYAKARELYEKSLELREGLLEAWHPELAESLSNVARFYRAIGLYNEAQPLYERAIAAYQHLFGDEHPTVATCQHNYGAFCVDLARYEQAEQLLQQALQVRLQLWGERHVSVAGSWHQLARLASKQGRYEQARELYERALAVYERVYGREHAYTALVLSNLGGLYLAQGDYARAEAILSEAITSFKKREDPSLPDTALALSLLGQVYLRQASYAIAQQWLSEALAIRQKKLGLVQPETAMSLKNLGDLASAQGEEEQAEQFYWQALQIIVTPLGLTHPDVVELLASYSQLLRKQGRQDELETFIQAQDASPEVEEC
ncbi:FxSxx-COOH system tetratricopeptide repeat protein [Ktedonosporobacter rubrisoli]|nr:FxSxx-COOH system tetratricopeptide repeat protein [Ktedonosporobacter rubrisoli]